MTAEDEKYCLRALSEGNKQAFEWLFLEWQPKLVAFFCRILGQNNEDTASDFAQDVFFDIWTSRKKFAEVKSFSAYLFQMARFKAFNHFDKNAVKARYEQEVTITGPTSVPTGEANLFADETNELIRKTLETLPQKRREVFIMSRVHGKSNDEIAVELGINKRTVENHITNVLAALRKVIKIFLVFCV